MISTAAPPGSAAPEIAGATTVASVATAVAQPSIEDSATDSVPVICGEIKGVLLVKQGRIEHEGQDISPTEFERLGGRASAKKWKNSVRVMLSDGTPGGTIGDWLQEHGVDIRNNQVSLVAEAGASRGASAAAARSAASDSALARMSRADQMRLGLLPGDETLGPLPYDMPSPPSSMASTVPVDVGRYTMAELSSMASATSAIPMGALLAQQPGVPPHRAAFVAGQQPQQRITKLEHVRRMNIVVETVLGQRAGSPWAALGSVTHMLAGAELDLRRLYEAAAELGGWHAVELSNGWQLVAARCGADLAAYPMAAEQARLYYSKLLHAVEKYERDRGTYARSGGGAPPAFGFSASAGIGGRGGGGAWPADPLSLDGPGLDAGGGGALGGMRHASVHSPLQLHGGGAYASVVPAARMITRPLAGGMAGMAGEPCDDPFSMLVGGTFATSPAAGGFADAGGRLGSPSTMLSSLHSSTSGSGGHAPNCHHTYDGGGGGGGLGFCYGDGPPLELLDLPGLQAQHEGAMAYSSDASSDVNAFLLDPHPCLPGGGPGVLQHNNGAGGLALAAKSAFAHRLEGRASVGPGESEGERHARATVAALTIGKRPSTADLMSLAAEQPKRARPGE